LFLPRPKPRFTLENDGPGRTRPLEGLLWVH
jgi:hypothetical protein